MKMDSKKIEKYSKKEQREILQICEELEAYYNRDTFEEWCSPNGYIVTVLRTAEILEKLKTYPEVFEEDIKNLGDVLSHETKRWRAHIDYRIKIAEQRLERLRDDEKW
jgi:hypothetical protein